MARYDMVDVGFLSIFRPMNNCCDFCVDKTPNQITSLRHRAASPGTIFTAMENPIEIAPLPAIQIANRPICYSQSQPVHKQIHRLGYVQSIHKNSIVPSLPVKLPPVGKLVTGFGFEPFIILGNIQYIHYTVSIEHNPPAAIA